MDRVGWRRYPWLWVAVVPIALWALVRVLGIEAGFPLLPMLAFTPYLAAAALLVAGLTVALRNWAAAALAGLAAVCLLATVLPRAIGSGEAAPTGSTELAVLSANVYVGSADERALIETIRRRDPDVLVVQELAPEYAVRLQRAGIGRLLPERSLALSPDASGGGIYSKLPLRPLPEPLLYPFRMPRAAVVLPDGRAVRIVDVHPFTPTRNSIGRWRAGLESLPTAGAGPPWVLAGDFNATLDHAELRELIARGYRDAADVTGEGLNATWPSGEQRSPPVTIDHILADERLAVLEYAVDDLPGSDHRTVFARLAVP